MYLFENKQIPYWQLVNSEDSLIALQLSQPWEKPITCSVAFEVESEAWVIQILLCLVFKSLHLAKCLVLFCFVFFVELKCLYKGLLECVAFPTQSIYLIDFFFTVVLDWKIPGCWTPNTIVLFHVFIMLFCKSHICLSYQCTAAKL